MRQISPECLDVLNFLRLQRYHKKRKQFMYGIAYISKKDAKDVLNISYSTLKRMMNEGLPHYKRGKKLYFSPTKVQDWFDKKYKVV